MKKKKHDKAKYMPPDKGYVKKSEHGKDSGKKSHLKHSFKKGKMSISGL